MKKDFLLFDLDGTLTDPKEGIANSIRYALRHFGIEPEAGDDLTRFIGPPLRETFLSFGFSRERVAEAIAQYRVYFSDRGILENRIYEGVAGMLEALHKRGRTLALATSKPAVYAERILRHFHIDRYFSFVSGSELDGRRTAKGEVIRYALEHLDGAKPEYAVMVGDREHDILGAREAGVACVGVLYGYGDREELEKAGAERIAESVEELQRALEQLAQT